MTIFFFVGGKTLLGEKISLKEDFYWEKIFFGKNFYWGKNCQEKIFVGKIFLIKKKIYFKKISTDKRQKVQESDEIDQNLVNEVTD